MDHVSTVDRPSSYGRGVRTPYADLPGPVHTWVEQLLGGSVTAAHDRIGGFSPGAATVVETTGGRSLFVKAVSGAQNPVSLALYQRERHQLAVIPRHPAIPHPVASTDLTVGDTDWVVTVFPALPGQPPEHPWTMRQASAAFDRLADLQADLAGADTSGLPDSRGLVDFFSRWPAILADPDDPWSHRQPAAAEQLLAAERRVQADCVGSAICHADLRADNLVMDGDQVWFVDWVEARQGAGWVDPVILATDLIISGADHADGGELSVIDFVAGQPAIEGVEGIDHFLDLVIALAGALHWLSRRPAPAGLPTIRGWQRLCSDRLIGYAGRHRSYAQI